MSHITSTAGTILIPRAHLPHLLEAVNEFCPDLEFVKGEAHYRTWKDDHNGKLVGDWPLPDGWTAAQIGEGAHHVIRVKDTYLKGRERNSTTSPYEIGVVPVAVTRDAKGNVLSTKYDAKGKEYALMTDWFANGNGILNCAGVGAREITKHPQTGKNTEMSFGSLYMHYRMMEAKAAARLSGDTIEFQKKPDGTYVGLVNTQVRLGV